MALLVSSLESFEGYQKAKVVMEAVRKTPESK